MKNILIGLFVWGLMNFILPILRNAVERVFKSQIDKVFIFTIHYIKIFLKAAIVWSFFIIFLPMIVLITLAEKIFPRAMNSYFFRRYKYFKDALLEKNLKKILVILNPLYSNERELRTRLELHPAVDPHGTITKLSR